MRDGISISKLGKRGKVFAVGGFAQKVRVKVEITSVGTGTLTQDAFQKTIKHLQLDMDGYPVKVSVDEGTDHHEHDSEA